MKSRARLKKPIKLNVCTHEIYDSVIGADSWPVGVRAYYPPILLENILASIIACKLGNKSIDYTRKTYLNGWAPEIVGLDASQPDLQTIHLLSAHIMNIERVVVENTYCVKYSSIQAIADFTFAKVPRSLHVALDLCAKGFLHEALSICRAAVEMVCWAYRIFDLTEGDDPFKYYPEKTISAFKPIYAGIGRYYGYLSEYSHWRPRTHIPVSNMHNKHNNNENLKIIYASGRNKWESIANVIMVLMFHTKAYCMNYAKLECIGGKTNMALKMMSVHQELRLSWNEWVKFFDKIDDPYLSKIFSDIIRSHEMESFLCSN